MMVFATTNYERDGTQTTAHSREKANELLESGWAEVSVDDGFRAPRRRGKGWYATAIKAGEVRDPNASPPETSEVNGHVVHVPLAESGAGGTEE